MFVPEGSAGCAYDAVRPKADGDATPAPLGQCPLSVLPVVYRIWASAWMVQLGGLVSGLGFLDLGLRCWWWSWFGGSLVYDCTGH